MEADDDELVETAETKIEIIQCLIEISWSEGRVPKS